jgi:hydroxyacylglutathione hydrolase
MLNIQPIAAFDDNYIWLGFDSETRQAFIVDPGDATPVIATLAQMHLELSAILITHHHYDHVGGLATLIETYQPAVFGPQNPAIEGITQRLCGGDTARVMGQTFQVMAVPGHTLDHIAYYASGDTPLLFCGDTLFAGGCGRMFEGDAPMMLESLNSLAALPPETAVYCAHEYTLANLAFAHAVEPDNSELTLRISQAKATRERGEPTVPSNIALELATNPFLRCDQRALLQSLQQQGRATGDTTAAVFANVRAWKDNF